MNNVIRTPTLTLLLGVLLTGIALSNDTATGQEENLYDEPRKITVKQDPGSVFYWVAPGPRKLSPKVFGTPGNLRKEATLEHKLSRAQKMIDKGKMPSGILDVLPNVPQLVGISRDSWEDGTIVRGRWDANNRKLIKDEDSDEYWYTRPTFFSNIAYPVPPKEGKKNHFELTYIDRQKKDTDGHPTDTRDDVTLDLEFHDPDGNKYRLEIFQTFQPPLPGYDTGGGVIVDGRHHGTTGTGSPLMPQVYNYGAYWAIGRLWVNGEGPQIRVTHAMTTEVVRDTSYLLATDERMPLPPEDRLVSTQNHHTHIVVVPVKPTALGPEFAPVKTAFTVKKGKLKGKKQPSIHIMFEQDNIVSGREHLDDLPDYLK
jgi:hypothetical protein